MDKTASPMELKINPYDPENDEANRYNIFDRRRPQLTLKKLNQLKKIRAQKAIDKAKREKFLGIMYARKKDES